MRKERVGFAICGSFCTHARVLAELEKLCGEYESVLPIVSGACTDTRFGTAEAFLASLERLTGHTAIGSIRDAEPIGPKKLLDVLVIAPCTGNTLGKLANGITDTAVTMAAKAHLRNDRPVVIAVSERCGQESGGTAGAEELLFRVVPIREDTRQRHNV